MTERPEPKGITRSDKRKEREGQPEPKPVEPNHPEPPKRPSSLWKRVAMPDGTFSGHFRIFREGKY